MNRTALGLAVGAGYLLGRTKKLKLALAVGSLAAGKKLNLGPRAIADQLNRQLLDNPQFKEIGDQLRQDLRGVGKAAGGAMVERQINSLADRLHGRTAQVRDQLSGIVPAGSDEEPDEDEERDEEEEQQEPEEKRGELKRPTGEDRGGTDEAPRKKTDKKPAKKAPAKKASGGTAAGKAPAKKAAAKKTDAARGTAARKTAAAGGAARSAVSRQSKGGDDR
ncbi:DNA primase [Streptomyces tricolor]|uniref:DNA primase n=1 Tax=Streptomyces tricolor TaxID=68277 RepID=A0ABS9JQ19_9ACTN|nr:MULTISPECIES: DNA primase [Streptomyces]MCG0067661.1 DNA primase [Streptomyces tricolor]